jgi:nucleotide-binding universal stress UspA family protein
MERYQTIVVAAGLDDRDATTLHHAARFASVAASKSVYVVHVAHSFDLPEEIVKEQREPVVPVDEEIEQRLRVLVEAQAGLFPGATQILCVARQGSLVAELVRLAAQKSADLLCLARRPLEAPDTLSDSALSLVRKTPCSVFVIPTGVEPQYERILVPVDFSDHSREALEVACALAQSTPGASVTAQHAYELPLGWHKSGRSAEEFAAIMKGHAERHWNDFLPTVNTRGVPLQVRFDLSENVPVPTTILAAADKIDANLLVMGSHGRTRPAAVLLGHVADTVCSRTARPVLCVKKKGEVVNFLRALLQWFEFEGR